MNRPSTKRNRSNQTASVVAASSSSSLSSSSSSSSETPSSSSSSASFAVSDLFSSWTTTKPSSSIKKPKRFANELTKATKKGGGDAEAQVFVGCHYLSSLSTDKIHKTAGKEKEDEKPVYWFEKAAEQDNGKAMWWLGHCHENGCGGVSKMDKNQAKKWYKKAIPLLKQYAKNDQDNSNNDNEDDGGEAAYLIAKSYRQGLGVGKDRTAAIKWFHRAALCHHVQALLVLAECCRFGRDGMTQNLVDATVLYQQAHEYGQQQQQQQQQQQRAESPLCELAHKHLEPLVLLLAKDDDDDDDNENNSKKKDKEVAADAEKLVKALNTLAYCHEHGVGDFPKNVRRAKELRQRAAAVATTQAIATTSVKKTENGDVDDDLSERKQPTLRSVKEQQEEEEEEEEEGNGTNKKDSEKKKKPRKKSSSSLLGSWFGSSSSSSSSSKNKQDAASSARARAVAKPFDVFLVHTGAQKRTEVATLKSILSHNGAGSSSLSCFLDQDDMTWTGGSPTECMQYSLESCRYVIAVVSREFLMRRDPCDELEYSFRRMEWLRRHGTWESLCVVLCNVTVEEYKQLRLTAPTTTRNTTTTTTDGSASSSSSLPSLGPHVTMKQWDASRPGGSWVDLCHEIKADIVQHDKGVSGVPGALPQWKAFVQKWRKGELNNNDDDDDDVKKEESTSDAAAAAAAVFPTANHLYTSQKRSKGGGTKTRLLIILLMMMLIVLLGGGVVISTQQGGRAARLEEALSSFLIQLGLRDEDKPRGIGKLFQNSNNNNNNKNNRNNKNNHGKHSSSFARK